MDNLSLLTAAVIGLVMLLVALGRHLLEPLAKQLGMALETLGELLNTILVPVKLVNRWAGAVCERLTLRITARQSRHQKKTLIIGC